MRIDGWRIDAFGILSEWQVSKLSGHRLVVVLGDNETGKSTLFEFLITALFGFSPARSSEHPYRPWGGEVLGGTMGVTLKDRGIAHIARRLRSAPQGRLTVNGTEQDIANRSVPWVGGMKRPIFESIYAITQDQAVELDSRTLQTVQDRVLGGSSVDYLRPPREVIEELQERRKQYWRTDRRGKPADRAIREAIRTAKKQLEDARERRPTIETLEQQVWEIGQEMSLQDASLQAIDVQLERDATLAPLFGRAQRIRELESKARALVLTDSLAPDLSDTRSASLEQIDALRDLVRSSDDHITELRKTIDVDAATTTVLAERREIETLDRLASRTYEDQDRKARMDKAAQRVGESLAEVASRTLAGEHLDAQVESFFLQLPIVELRGLHGQWSVNHLELLSHTEALRACRDDRLGLQDLLETGPPESNPRQLDDRMAKLRGVQLTMDVRGNRSGIMQALALLLLGISLSLVTAWGMSEKVVSLGGGVVAIGFISLTAAGVVTRWRRQAIRATRDLKEALQELKISTAACIDDEIIRTARSKDRSIRHQTLSEQHRRAVEKEAELRDRSTAAENLAQVSKSRFVRLVQGLPIVPARLTGPDASLVADLEMMRRLITQLSDIQEDLDQVGERIKAWRAKLDKVRTRLHDELPDDPFDAAAKARDRLDKAVKMQDSARNAADEITQASSSLKKTRNHLEVLISGVKNVDVQLARLDPHGDDAEAGLRALNKSRSYRKEALRMQGDLDRETPGWTEQVAAGEKLLQNGEAIALNDEERVALRRRKNDLQRAKEGNADERGRLRAEIDSLTKQPGPAHVAGDIQALKTELVSVRKKHDRLAVLENLIRLADAQFREKYQSPLIQRAAGHLTNVTNGRYDMLNIDDISKGNCDLEVRLAGSEFPEIAQKPISRGTIQQIYFALRLALVDQLETDEPLPIFLDEMFVNWDPSRTERGISELLEMSGERQVFLFTADPYWAERAMQGIDAHLVATPVHAQ